MVRRKCCTITRSNLRSRAKVKIGVPKEIKDGERRVGLTPANVKELVDAGHEVFVDETAGEGSGFFGKDYRAAGARLVKDGKAYDGTELVIKVKEPTYQECKLMHPGQLIFAYLHLAASPDTLRGLIEAKVTAIAYENVFRAAHYPLVAPMSIIAGKLSIQTGAELLAQHSGVMLSDYYGLPQTKVFVIGAGVSGTAAMHLAAQMGAEVRVFDINQGRVDTINTKERTIKAYHINELETHLAQSPDLIVGAVLRPGRKTPIVLSRDMMKSLKPGTVFIDISIDQGGCAETSRPTTHSNPTFDFDGVLHYCVTNMPGKVPRTSTLALTNVTMPYIHLLASFEARSDASWDDVKPAVAVRAGEIVDSRLKSL